MFYYISTFHSLSLFYFSNPLLYKDAEAATLCNVVITKAEVNVKHKHLPTPKSSFASGNNSNRATYNIAPLAKPRQLGPNFVAGAAGNWNTQVLTGSRGMWT